MRSWAGPVTSILVLRHKIALLCSIAAKMAYVLSCMYFYFKSMQISKVTRVHKAVTAPNDECLWLCFLNFILVDWAEIFQMNKQQNLSR